MKVITEKPAKKARPHWMNVLFTAAGELVFALIALPLYAYMVLSSKRQAGVLPGLVPPLSPDANPSLAVLSVFGVVVASIGVIALLSQLFGGEHFQVEAVDKLLREYSTRDLVFIYIVAGFAEEFLFRVTLVGLCGLLISTVLFAVVHVSYWRKPFMLLYVFAVGLMLGAMYLYTGSLILCAIAHAAYNLAVSLLMKIGFLPMDKWK